MSARKFVRFERQWPSAETSGRGPEMITVKGWECGGLVAQWPLGSYDGLPKHPKEAGWIISHAASGQALSQKRYDLLRDAKAAIVALLDAYPWAELDVNDKEQVNKAHEAWRACEAHL